MDAATLFTLIVITHGGNVDVSEFRTEALCLDAKSLALTGYTVAEKAEVDKKREQAQREAEAGWLVAHPPRAPSTPEEIVAVAKAQSNGWPEFIGSSEIDSQLVARTDGFIYTERYLPAEMYTISDGDVKEARCIAGLEVE
jgi:hypothetical protein